MFNLSNASTVEGSLLGNKRSDWKDNAVQRREERRLRMQEYSRRYREKQKYSLTTIADSDLMAENASLKDKVAKQEIKIRQFEQLFGLNNPVLKANPGKLRKVVSFNLARQIVKLHLPLIVPIPAFKSAKTKEALEIFLENYRIDLENYEGNEQLVTIVRKMQEYRCN